MGGFHELTVKRRQKDKHRKFQKQIHSSSECGLFPNYTLTTIEINSCVLNGRIKKQRLLWRRQNLGFNIINNRTPVKQRLKNTIKLLSHYYKVALVRVSAEIPYGHRSVCAWDLLDPGETKFHGSSSILNKTLQYLHTTYELLARFESSLDYL